MHQDGIRLWLDDVRDPALHGHIGWTWVQTAEEAIRLLAEGHVWTASLDHDLSDRMAAGAIDWRDEATGYDVVLWLEEHPDRFPPGGVKVHSQNPAGRARMEAGIAAILRRRERGR
jgi:hypothetical protein